MEFKFQNKTYQEEIQGNKITLIADKNTDFFNFFDVNESKVKKIATAPFMYTEVAGDFIVTVKVSVEFKDTYDSAVLMLMENEDKWAKACFELTDFGKTAVVSVVTNALSDDANGANTDEKEVYLKAVRVNNDFSFHYSLDGVRYEMMRFFHLDVDSTIKIGLVAQSPVGNGTKCTFENFEVDLRTAKNIRKGE